MCLKKEQLNFLKKEFSLTFDKVVKMKKNEWDELREKCFDIEVDEAMNGEEGIAEDWDRANMAVSIFKTPYSEILAMA